LKPQNLTRLILLPPVRVLFSAQTVQRNQRDDLQADGQHKPHTIKASFPVLYLRASYVTVAVFVWRIEGRVGTMDVSEPLSPRGKGSEPESSPPSTATTVSSGYMMSSSKRRYLRPCDELPAPPAPKVGGALGSDKPVFFAYFELALDPSRRGARWLRRGLTVGRAPQMQERLVSAKLCHPCQRRRRSEDPWRHIHPEQHGASTPRLINIAHRVDERNKTHNGSECSTVQD
jgi:hypothetical protein